MAQLIHVGNDSESYLVQMSREEFAVAFGPEITDAGSAGSVLEMFRPAKTAEALRRALTRANALVDRLEESLK